MGNSKSGIPAAEIMQELQRLLASRQLQRSHELGRFLRYVVEQSVQGGTAQLKEQLLGTEVFGRGPGFDPRTDPIVRVQARTLRAKLADYYALEGSRDPILIDLPKGGYVPQFRTARKTAPVSGTVRLRRVGLAVACLAVLFLVRAFVRWRTEAGHWELQQLTFATGDSSSPSASSDGRWLAFISDRGAEGTAGVWVQDLKTGGSPVRLTATDVNAMTAEISPDSSHVVYRANREGGGVYTVPVRGGEEKKLGAGYSPRYSPDGSRVAFASANGRGGQSIFVVPSGGGRVIEAVKGTNARCPIWSPDGRHLIYTEVIDPAGDDFDWWLASVPWIRGPAPVRTHVSDARIRRGLPKMDVNSCPESWLGEDILFTIPSVNIDHLWSVAISSGTGRMIRPPRIVFDSTGVRGPRFVAQPNRRPEILFASGGKRVAIWALPIDQESGTCDRRSEASHRRHDSAARAGWHERTPVARRALARIRLPALWKCRYLA